MRKLVFAAGLLMALLPAASALGASFPKPASNLIVVPKSIGGISLGMPEGKARAAWGKKRGSCQTFSNGVSGCEYGDASSPAGFAYLEFRKHKVSGVSIGAGYRKDGSQKTSAAPVLMKLKDENGIGIGAKLSKVRRAYPKGTQSGKPSEPAFGYRLKAKGKSSMTFGIAGSNKKVFSVYLNDGRGG